MARSNDWLAYLALGLGNAMAGYSQQRNVRLARERQEQSDEESKDRYEREWERHKRERTEDIDRLTQRDKETTLWRMRSEGMQKKSLEERQRANKVREGQAEKRSDLSERMFKAQSELDRAREKRLSQKESRSPFADVPIADRQQLMYRLSQLTPEGAQALQKKISEGKGPDINDKTFLNDIGFFDEGKYKAASSAFSKQRSMDESLLSLYQQKQAAQAKQAVEQPNQITGEPAIAPTRMPSPEEQAMQAGEQNANAIQQAQHGLPGLTERDQMEAGEVMRMVPIILNPNLPVPMQLQAWVRFQQLTGIEPPEEIKAVLNAQGGPMGGSVLPQALQVGNQVGIDPALMR